MANKRNQRIDSATDRGEESTQTLRQIIQSSEGTDVLLRLPQVQAMFPVSRSVWYAGIQMGIYPPAVKLSQRCVAWRRSQILELIARRASPIP